jgi:hypothetical protein
MFIYAYILQITKLKHRESGHLGTQGHKLLEHLENVRIQIVGEEKSLESGAVLLHLLVMLKIKFTNISQLQ